MTSHYLANIFSDQFLPVCPGLVLILPFKVPHPGIVPVLNWKFYIPEPSQSLIKTIHLLFLIQPRWNFLSYCFFFLIGHCLCYSVFLKCSLLLHSCSPSSSRKPPLPAPIHPDHPLKGISIVFIDSITLYCFSSCLFDCFSTIPFMLVINLIHSQSLCFISHYISVLSNIIASNHMWPFNLNSFKLNKIQNWVSQLQQPHSKFS